MNCFTIYLTLINVVAFIIMGVDKSRAVRHRWRVRESTLFLSAIVGGSIGALLGMLLFRHKTNHRSFRTGLPVILVIHIIIFVTFRNVLF